MPLKFWDEAFLTATYLINMLPSKVIHHDTPVHRLLGTRPDYSSLRVFGCACWPNLRPYNKRKLAFRSKQCVFLGYSPRHKGVKCLDIATGRVYVSRDVVFDEAVFPFQNLHPNVGALLRKEILLLDPLLHNFKLGDAHDNDSNMANTSTTDPAPSSSCVAPQVSAGRRRTRGENLSPNGASGAENSSHTIIPENANSTGHEEDFLTESSSGSAHSSSDHTLSSSDGAGSDPLSAHTREIRPSCVASTRRPQARDLLRQVLLRLAPTPGHTDRLRTCRI
jgi:hypothetical protein